MNPQAPKIIKTPTELQHQRMLLFRFNL